MTAHQLISELQDLGVQLWAQEGRLRFRAPKGVLTGTRREALAEHRDEILGLLDAEEPVVVPDPAARHEPFPLTDVQTAYLLGRRASFGYGGVACHGYLEVHYPVLDPEAAETAWNVLVARHDMLRAVLEEDGYQRILPEVPPLRITVHDLRTAADPAAEIDRIREELGHRVYDTTRWPLFEPRIVRTAEGDRMHISLDSLIADWGSAAILLDEFDTLVAGGELPPLDLTFRDYLLAERRYRDTARYQRDREYWRARIDQLPAAPELPSAPHPEDDGPVRFRRHRFRLAAEEWSRLRERAAAHGVTAGNVVLAAYASVLDRWSRGGRFSLNVTLLNRLPLHPAVDRIVGDFTSVSVLAVEPLAGKSFLDRVRGLGAQLFADLEHRLYSGVEVLREVARARGREQALLPVVFTSALGLGPGDAPASGRRLGAGITQTPQVFLDCQVNDGAQGLVVDWDERQGIFPDGLVADMFDAFSAVLSALADEEQAWFAEEPVALPSWQVAERDKVNDTAGPLRDALLHQGFFEQAARTPDAVAVISAAGELSYGDLARRAGAVAATLPAGPEPVAVVMDKGPDQLAAALGVLLAGRAYLPLDTTQPRLRRDKVIAGAGVRHVLTRVDRLTPEADIPPVVPGDPDAPAYVIYTSGSTGAPKGVVISHRAALNTIDDISERFSVGPHDRVLGLAQLGFDLSVYDVFGVLAAGGAVVLPDPARGADPSHWADLVARHGVTLWNSVPAQLQMLTGYLESDPMALPSLRLALLSGDWIPVPLPGKAKELVPGLETVSLGGATEASIWSIVHPIDDVDPTLPSIPYGVPLRNQGFRVLDESFRDCPVWTVGELCITGSGLALGYLGDAELTAAKFVTHPRDGTRLYRTGDLGRYLPGGEIEFLGREDGQVKIRGHRVELGEIETVLQTHSAVGAAAVVVGEEGGLLGFAVPAHGTAEPVDMQRLRETVSRHAQRQIGESDPTLVRKYIEELHHASRLSMLHALAGRGAFSGAESADDVLSAARVAGRHRWLVRQWLESLVDGYQAVPSADEVREAWERVEARSREGLCTKEFVAYHRAHADRLDALLDDEQNPFELLFPEGQAGPAHAVYRDDPAARYLNAGAAAVLLRIAAAHDSGRPLRVLEAGAGTGATTASVLPLLAGHDVDYHFTDVTAFHLSAARTEFSGEGVRFGLFDVDGELREQGFAPNSVEVVLAAGVLSSTVDPAAALTTITDLLAPGGWLVFTEPTGSHPNIMLTQGFMMRPGDDDHGPSPLLSRTRWRELLADVGAEEVLCLPGDEHALAAHGMHLFAARVKTDRTPVHPVDLEDFLAERLPAHMVPGCLQVVDALPVTANGKVDRRVLAGWRPAQLAAEPEAPTGGGLEQRLTAHWADALGTNRIGRTESFYDHGADSLIMARMAGRLREEVPEAAGFAYDTLLRQMLNEPTVAALARMLAADPAPEPSAARRAGQGNALLVPFGGDGDGPMRVLFHAALGTMDYFQELGKSLAVQDLGPVTGLAVRDAEAYCAQSPGGLLSTVADDYARSLAAEGHSRFQLVGYCLGGLLAVEVARRLAERGLDVVDLTLVDSIPMFLETDEELAFEAIFVPNLDLDPVSAVFGEDVDAADVYRAVELLMAEYGGRVPAGALAELGGDPGLAAVAAAARRRAEIQQEERLAGYARAAAEQSGLPVDAELVPALYRVCRHSMIAARFDPEPYAGDLTFLRAAEQQSFGITGGVGHLAAPFWERTCLGRFTVHDVPGNHFSVIQPPHLAAVAEHLAAPLRRAAGSEARP
ncbi:non-ribosomal peptide synthetase [Amycolatopsis jejuensis]|uniref:non-ribosomal peptide synthetase n=1 Tax=Amycolatopsis jejuensis TaxID=330084 RepID=UPI0005273E80|nr:non-ribosomal peptide synthetase [Amycolatopsis jejuensis]